MSSTPTTAAPGFVRPSLVRIAAVGLVLAYALAFQGSRGIWEPDEGRYTDIATQILRSGDFVTPAFNDEVPHFAKPPLVYWVIAGSVSVVGWNEWGARLPNALAFAVTVLAIGALGRRMLPVRPWLPAVVYATFLLPYVAANAVTTDTLLTMWETLAVLCCSAAPVGATGSSARCGAGQPSPSSDGGPRGGAVKKDRSRRSCTDCADRAHFAMADHATLLQRTSRRGGISRRRRLGMSAVHSPRHSEGARRYA